MTKETIIEVFKKYYGEMYPEYLNQFASELLTKIEAERKEEAKCNWCNKLLSECKCKSGQGYILVPPQDFTERVINKIGNWLGEVSVPKEHWKDAYSFIANQIGFEYSQDLGEKERLLETEKEVNKNLVEANQSLSARIKELEEADIKIFHVILKSKNLIVGSFRKKERAEKYVGEHFLYKYDIKEVEVLGIKAFINSSETSISALHNQIVEEKERTIKVLNEAVKFHEDKKLKFLNECNKAHKRISQLEQENERLKADLGS